MYLYNKNTLKYVEIVGTEPKYMIHANKGHSNNLCLIFKDHTLRVFRLDDHMAVYTLHGHLGPVTAAFIDKEEPSR